MRARVLSEVTPTDREANWAVAVAGGLYLLGALLCSTAVLLPHVRSPAGVTAVGLVAVATGTTLLIIWRRGRGTLEIALAADLWGIVEIGVLCWATGGSYSPFALIYMFAIVHAAPSSRCAACTPRRCGSPFSPRSSTKSTSRNCSGRPPHGIALAPAHQRRAELRAQPIREQRRRLQLLNTASASLDRSLDPAESLLRDRRAAVPDFAPVCVDVLDPGGSIGSTVLAGADATLAAPSSSPHDARRRPARRGRRQPGGAARRQRRQDPGGRAPARRREHAPR
jgi:hypothetical protein